MTATSGTFKNCTIEDSCTIGGVRLDGAFLRQVNMYDGFVGTSKIADAAISTAKIQDAAITNAKIANLSANKITAGTISTTSITLSTSSGYLTCGTNTNHPSVSGLNVGSYGIAMGGHEISDIGNMSVNTITTYNTSAVNFNAGLNVSGPLYAGEVSDFYRGVNAATLYVKRTDAAGNDNGYYTIQINRGIVHNVVAHDP